MQSGDIEVISSALDLFTKAIATKTAGRGLNGYKFMLELVVGQMPKIVAMTLQLNGCSWLWKK